MTRTPTHRLPHANEHFAAIMRRVGGPQRVLLGLDFDGTLVPLEARPEDARMSAQIRNALDRLHAYAPLAFISGRDRERLESAVGISDAIYAGAHGLDIRGPGYALAPPIDLETLYELDQRLVQHIGDDPAAAWIERKRFGLAVHYRRAPNRADAIRSAIEQAIAEHPAARRGWSHLEGDHVQELRPATAGHKGTALQFILEREAERRSLPVDQLVPIFIGDDTTDEDALEVTRERGIGIRVAHRPSATRAHFRLDHLEDVEAFLTRLADALAPGAYRATSACDACSATGTRLS